MDMSKKFNWSVDARSILYVPVEPKSKVTLLFNVLEEIDMPLVSEYKDNNIKKRQISYNADESNTIFKNINSGGLGDVNFDGSNDYEFEGNNDKKSNNDGLIAFGIIVIGAGLIINAISKMK